MRKHSDIVVDLTARIRRIEPQYHKVDFAPVNTWSEWIPADAFAITKGAPAFGQYRRGNVYTFQNGVTDGISAFWRLGREVASSTQIYFVPYISARTATSGYFYCQITAAFINDNEQITAVGVGSSDIRQIPVQGTVNYLTIYRFPNSFSGSSKDMICIDFERQGAHASDTATGLMDFYGMEVFLPDTLL